MKVFMIITVEVVVVVVVVVVKGTFWSQDNSHSQFWDMSTMGHTHIPLRRNSQTWL